LNNWTQYFKKCTNLYNVHPASVRVKGLSSFVVRPAFGGCCPDIGALGNDGVISSIYIRALIRGTTLRPLMEKDTADDKKIDLKDVTPGSIVQKKVIHQTLTNKIVSLHNIYHNEKQKQKNNADDVKISLKDEIPGSNSRDSPHMNFIKNKYPYILFIIKIYIFFNKA